MQRRLVLTTSRFEISTPEFDGQHIKRPPCGPYHRSWDSGTSTELEQTQTQQFKQELYQPFDELAEPEIVSSDEELPFPLDSQRIQEDIERCVSAMAMDLGPDASLPPVPEDGDLPRLLESPQKKAKAAWSPHDLCGPGLNFGPSSPARQVVPKACPPQNAPLASEPEMTNNLLFELLKQGKQTQEQLSVIGDRTLSLEAKVELQGNSFKTAIADVREQLEVGLRLNKDELKEDMRTHMKKFEDSN